MAMARSDDFKTPLCRLSYAGGLFKARSQGEGGKPKFGCTLIFPLAARAELEKVVAKVVTDEWGPKGLEKAKAGLIKLPFLKGDGKEARNKTSGELHPGMGPEVFFIRAGAGEERPPFAIWKTKLPDGKWLQEVEATVYSGCYVKAVINAYAWKHPQNGDGVSFGLQGVQKQAEGERLGGSGSADPAKWAEAIDDVGDAPDVTRNGGGASSLFG